jgi:hypothetical protein
VPTEIHSPRTLQWSTYWSTPNRPPPPGLSYQCRVGCERVSILIHRRSFPLFFFLSCRPVLSCNVKLTQHRSHHTVAVRPFFTFGLRPFCSYASSYLSTTTTRSFTPICPPPLEQVKRVYLYLSSCSLRRRALSLSHKCASFHSSSLHASVSRMVVRLFCNQRGFLEYESESKDRNRHRPG